MRDDAGTPPLDGLRVLDLTTLLPGPFATQILVDLGATVLKIERPGGDPMRHIGQGVYSAVNRGKLSAVLDLKDVADKQRLLELVSGADVLLENNRPGVLDRLGLGFERLRQQNSGLVQVSLSGWGQEGPAAQESGHNGNYSARAGATFLTGPPGSAPSEAVPVALADLSTALYAVIGVLAAVRGGRREAVHIDVSLFGSALAMMAPRFAEYVSKGGPPRDELLRRPANGTFRTGDGRYVTIAAVENHFWAGLCRAIGRPDLARRVDLGTYDERLAHADEVDNAITQALTAGSRDEWVATLRANDVPVAPVLEPWEVPQDPQVRHLGAFSSWPDVRAFLPIKGLPRREPSTVTVLDGEGDAVRSHGWPDR